MFKAKYLTELFGGTIPRQYISLCTDSRKYKNEDVFWCLNGPSFRGSDYVESVYKKGCLLFFLEKASYKEGLAKKCPKATFFTTDNALASLQDLGNKCVEEEKCRGLISIGITGSNGKTTVKEITAFILRKLVGQDQVFATQENFNNHIGVPLTILSMSEKTRFLIVEMGTNYPGEIENLAHLSMPDVGIITNIGEAHLKFFKNKRGVLKEKTSLYNYIRDHSQQPLAIINHDDEMLSTCNYPFSITFSENKDSSYNYTIDNNRILILGRKKYIIANKNIKEHYNLVNLLQSTLFLMHLLPHRKNDILEIAEDVSLPDNNRSTWKYYRGIKVFLDAYNANPASMNASLRSFKKATESLDREKILLILGDMNELGENTRSSHRKIGKLTKDLGFRNVYFVGRYSGYYLEGHERGIAFKETKKLLNQWKNIPRLYKAVFLKGSRSLQLESLLDIV